MWSPPNRIAFQETPPPANGTACRFRTLSTKAALIRMLPPTEEGVSLSHRPIDHVQRGSDKERPQITVSALPRGRQPENVGYHWPSTLLPRAARGSCRLWPCRHHPWRLFGTERVLRRGSGKYRFEHFLELVCRRLREHPCQRPERIDPDQIQGGRAGASLAHSRRRQDPDAEQHVHDRRKRAAHERQGQVVQQPASL